jgi:methylated-DNA-[protein]-cysteine S-methyltransferase
MRASGYHLFDTAIGTCGVAWGEHGIVAVQLPEGRAAHLVARLRERIADAVEMAPPPEVQRVIERVIALLRGEADDLCDVPLDMRGIPEFDRAVYDITRHIPPGQTLTYGEIAQRLGQPGTARAVGQALGRNPFAPVVPCHRVLAAGGKPGGFSASGGVETKLRMLAIEGARAGDGPDLFDSLSR